MKCLRRNYDIHFHMSILEPGIIHHLTVTVLSNSSVKVSWEPPLLSNGVILHYYISIRSLAANQSVIFKTEKNLYHIIYYLS